MTMFLFSSSLTPSTKALTPGTLEKLFASTPRQEPEGITYGNIN